MSELLPCEVAMGLIRGREIQELVTEATGQTCPCRLGEPCPLLPYAGVEDPALKVPPVTGGEVEVG